MTDSRKKKPLLPSGWSVINCETGKVKKRKTPSTMREWYTTAKGRKRSALARATEVDDLIFDAVSLLHDVAVKALEFDEFTTEALFQEAHYTAKHVLMPFRKGWVRHFEKILRQDGGYRAARRRVQHLRTLLKELES
jgi:hypothetical protein